MSGRAAAFFDLDKTVIAKSSTLVLGRPFYDSGLINRRAMAKSAYAQFVYRIGGADEDQMARMRDDLAAMVSGWPVQQVHDVVAETLHELIDPLIYDDAAALIESHHAVGRDVVIVSSSGTEVVEPIGELLGADYVVATRMEVVDGRYTGTVEFYCAGPNKAVAMRALAERNGYDLADCYAYSDSYTDLPMLEAVGHPCAVNPDRALRREANTRGWPVLDFRRTVPLRERFGRMPVPTRSVAIGAGATAVVLAVAGWQVGRRRRLRHAASPLGRKIRG